MIKTNQPSKPTRLTQAPFMTSMKSNSLKQTGGYNEISMNDDSGKEGLFMKAQKDQINNVGNDSEKVVGNDEMINIGNSRVTVIGNNSDDAIGNDETRTIANNQQESIGTNQTLNVGVTRTKEVGVTESSSIGMAKMLSTGVANNDMVGIMRGTETGVLCFDCTGIAHADLVGMARLKMVGLVDIQLTGISRYEKTGKDYNVDAGNSINQTAAADVITQAGANAGLKAGSMIVIEAPDITLKAGGGFIRIDGSGVTIQGTQVKINCAGGSPGSLGGGPGLGGGTAGDGAGGGAAGAGAAGTGGAAGAGGAAALKTDFASMLDKLGVPAEYTKVIDQLLTDPMNVKFSDLMAIAPTWDSLTKYIPEDILPAKYRGILNNMLRAANGELAPGESGEEIASNKKRRDDALKAIQDEVKNMGKDQIEKYAKEHGLDKELLKNLGLDGSGDTKAKTDQKATDAPKTAGPPGQPPPSAPPAKQDTASPRSRNLETPSTTDSTGELPPPPAGDSTPPGTGQGNGDMLACPTTKPDLRNMPAGWQSYEGDSRAFHCGYEGIKETTPPSPSSGRLQNECFYDERGNLVDESHAYAGCRGTPNEYDATTDTWDHIWNDKGGIRHAGWEGASTSVRKTTDDIGDWSSEKWDAIKGIFN